jgi:5,10-methylenetetrahydromethanopterin reductase
MSIRTGIWFTGGTPVGLVAEQAAAAERAGVIDSVWVAEAPSGRDALVTLGAVAVVTERVSLGTGVVNPYTRHPAQLAASFATLDEASSGRAICGVGIGARDQLALLGYDVSRPLSAARETVEMLVPLLARETVDHQGPKFRAERTRLGFRPLRPAIPIYLGATGPKMCELAGEIADGIYLPHGTPRYLTEAIARSRARRPAGGAFDVACQLVMSVDDDRVTAENRARPTVGLVLTEPNGEGVMEANGLDPSLVQPIRDALRDGGIRAMAAAIDEEILRAFAITGTPADCAEQLRQVVAVGVTHPVVSVLGEHVEPTLEVLADLAASPARTEAA